MPYIDFRARDRLEDGASTPTSPGELNYLITKIVVDYYDSMGGYQRINDVLGALEGAKLEFYRRVAVPYEDQKMKENGDVYLPR